MIIDGHSHGMHGGHLDELIAAAGQCGDWMEQQVGKLRQRTARTPQILDVALRVEQLERSGIDMQVVTPNLVVDANLVPADLSVQLAVARATNDNMARLMEDSKGRLIAAGTVPITRFDAAAQRELERAIHHLGLKAMNLPTNLNGVPLDSPDHEDFWSAVESMDVTVYLHPLEQPGRPYEQGYDLPHTFGWPYETTLTLARLVFTGVMERHPTLKIVSHHLGGGMIPFFMGRIDESNNPTSSTLYKNAPMARSWHDYFSLFYYDSAVGGSAAAIKCAYETFGASQIIFATDAPNGPEEGLYRLEAYPKVIRSLGLPETDTENILSGNLRRILNLP